MLIGAQRALIRSPAVAAVSSFAPSDIASLWSWLDPAVDSFQLINGTTAATSDGDLVGYCTDRSGNSRHWIAVTNTAERPVLKTNILNGHPVLRFTPADQTRLLGSDLSGLTAGEVFIIVKMDTDPPGASGDSGLWLLGTDGGNQDHYPFTDGNVYMGALSTARKSTGNPTPALTSFHLLNIWSASADWDMLINGTSHFSTGTNTFGGASSPAIGISVGVYMDGDIAEMCIFSAKLSAGDRTSMKSYFATKYALTIA